jgi:hypothetical protein
MRLPLVRPYQVTKVLMRATVPSHALLPELLWKTEHVVSRSTICLRKSLPTLVGCVPCRCRFS